MYVDNLVYKHSCKQQTTQAVLHIFVLVKRYHKGNNIVENNSPEMCCTILTHFNKYGYPLRVQ